MDSKDTNSLQAPTLDRLLARLLGIVSLAPLAAAPLATAPLAAAPRRLLLSRAPVGLLHHRQHALHHEVLLPGQHGARLLVGVHLLLHTVDERVKIVCWVWGEEIKEMGVGRGDIRNGYEIKKEGEEGEEVEYKTHQCSDST